MKRRDFLKLIGVTTVIPNIVMAETKPVRNLLEDTIFNGQVFEAPWPLCHTVIVMYFGRGDQWLLLSSPYRTSYSTWNTAVIPCYYIRKDGSDNPFYTQKQLQEKLKDWKLVKSKLILDEKIYA